MEIKGTIIMRYMHAGSKSEGWKAFLMAEDLAVYQLFRKDVYPIDDDYFYPFDRKDVIVTGTVVDTTFVDVDRIELIHADETLINEENNE